MRITQNAASLQAARLTNSLSTRVSSLAGSAASTATARASLTDTTGLSFSAAVSSQASALRAAQDSALTASSAASSLSHIDAMVSSMRSMAEQAFGSSAEERSMFSAALADVMDSIDRVAQQQLANGATLQANMNVDIDGTAVAATTRGIDSTALNLRSVDLAADPTQALRIIDTAREIIAGQRSTAMEASAQAAMHASRLVASNRPSFGASTMAGIDSLASSHADSMDTDIAHQTARMTSMMMLSNASSALRAHSQVGLGRAVALLD
jgi:hypothetical protein